MKIVYRVVLITFLFFFSCDTNSTEYSEKDVFRINRYDNVSSLDPAFAKNQANTWMVNLIFNGLVKLNNQLEIEGDIAKDWDVSSDGRVYRFVLRKNVFFQSHPYWNTLPNNTRNVVAQDVKYSFDRLLDPKVTSPGKWVLDAVKDYTAINDTVFQITLKKPFPAFLGLLTNKYCSVVPKEIVEQLGNKFNQYPIGTGPFYVKMWEPNVKLVLRKNPLYFEQDKKGQSLPYLESVAVSFIQDRQTEFIRFANGYFDMMTGLDASYIQEILTQEGTLHPNYRDSFKLLKNPYLNTEYIGFYVGDKGAEVVPKEIRQAINYAIDRKEMITFLRNGIGIPAEGGFLPSAFFKETPNYGFNYDVVKAKKILDSYKKNNGNLPVVEIVTNASYLDIVEYIQGAMSKLGLEININVMTPSSIKQGRAQGKLQSFRASWIADYPDEENYLSLFHSKNHTPNGPNYTHYTSSIYDKLMNEAIQETDLVKRKKKYRYLDSLMIQEAPIIPLFYDQVTLFVSKKVQGLEPNAINMLHLTRVRKSD